MFRINHQKKPKLKDSPGSQVSKPLNSPINNAMNTNDRDAEKFTGTGLKLDFSNMPAFSTMPVVQTRLAVNIPGDKFEQEAEAMADKVMRMPNTNNIQRKCDKCEEDNEEHIQRKPIASDLTTVTQPNNENGSAISASLNNAIAASQGSGTKMDKSTHSFMSKRFGFDFGNIKIHTDHEAIKMNRELNAKAFTVGNDIYFNKGEYNPGLDNGRHLLAHELTHTIQQGTKAIPGNIFRKTKGETMVGKSDSFIDEDDNLKAEIDVLKQALKEIKAGKNVDFNKAAGIKKVDAAGKILSLSAASITQLEKDWQALVADPANTTLSTKFFNSFTSRIDTLSKAHPGNKVKYWLRNTPATIVDVIYKVATVDMPATEVYNYAMIEGLIDWIRDKIGVSGSGRPTKTQLGAVTSAGTVSGFAYLGMDDFVTDYEDKDQLIKTALPAGFDSKFTEASNINEHGRTVRSADFVDMDSALKAFVASFSRRRKLFVDDAAAFGYTSPTRDELIYWTYVYYNPGIFGGKASLKKNAGKRTLSDWITKKEFPNALSVLNNFKMVESLNLF